MQKKEERERNLRQVMCAQMQPVVCNKDINRRLFTHTRHTEKRVFFRL